MNLKTFNLVQGIFYSLLGVFLLANMPTNIVGNVIGLRQLATSMNLFFGVLFFIGGMALIIISRK